MKRTAILFLLLIAGCCGTSIEAAEPTKISFETYSGYFVSNKFEPKAAQSFLVVTDQAQFDKVFGVAMVMNDKSHRLPKDAFKANIVLAIIKRGKAIWEFKVDSVTEVNHVAELRYRASAKNSDSATFASPLIASIPVGPYQSVRFVENGKLVATVQVPARLSNGPSAADNDPFRGPPTSGNDPFRLHLRAGVKSPFDKKGSAARYIPEDLDGCFAELKKILSETEVQKMKAGPERDIDCYYYGFSDQEFEAIYRLDQFLRYAWKLDTGSRLSSWFKARGLDDADDMAEIIVHSFWRHLNSQSINLDAEIQKRRVYIPKDLDECFDELKKKLSEKQVEKMKNGREEEMFRYHHGLGRWLRNKWGLWKGSRLSRWFNDKGIRHPDDMSGIIFISFWRHLNNRPINLESQIKHYQDYWKRAAEERKASQKKEAKTQ
jgi:hypothetical protein